MLPADRPRLETERLVLRRPEASDVARVQTLLANWEIAKWLGALPSPYTRGAAAEWFERVSRGHARGEKCVFGIFLKERPTDGIMGNIGLHRHDEGNWGLGFWLGEPYWRRGYMSEAASAVVRFAFASLKVERLEALHFVGNDGSARMLQRCGFKEVGERREWCEARGHDVDGIEMVLTRADFNAR